MVRTYSFLLIAAILAGCGGGGGNPVPSCAVPCLSPTPYCDTTVHLCVACLEDSDCDRGTICAVDQKGARACVKGCKSDADCAAQGLAGQTCCSRSCVDTRTSLMSCGACGMACPAPAHGVASCAAGKCGIASCEVNFADCDGMAQDGCEAATLSDPRNCGGCGKACPAVANGMPGCSAGACGIDACLGSFADCDKQLANGCEVDTAVDQANCGACGKACGNVANGIPVCKLGACTIAVCSQGYGNCDGAYANGCESLLASDIANCGNCGRACQTPPNATATCTAGACGIGTCKMGYADCDGVLVNGCESDVSTDPANCGTCGRACPVIANGACACKGGACVITSCDNGWADCDGNVQNGCEAQLATSVANCGGCGKACAGVPNGLVACQGGACAVGSCFPGYADCDGQVRTGCETATTSDPMNCGMCAKVCPAVMNGAPACKAGLCGVGACDAGWGDCDGNTQNGCERSLLNDANNCGACGNACAGVANGTGGCAGAKCSVLSCNAGYADCDMQYANGCEVNKQNDARNCGGCGLACPVRPNTTPVCMAQACSYICSGGYADCDAQPANGCEAQLATDANNCGSCGKVCALPNANAGCAASACVVASCLNGFGNCDGNAQNGCETNVLSSNANCGGCGVVCTFANAVGACMGGGCVIASCNAGYGNCDGNGQNGCEATINTDKNNCGACGVVCANNQTCVGGVCKLGIKVLLVHAESTASYYTDVQTKLQATGAFTAVDLFYAGGGLTPTLAQLQPYDSVFVWSDGTFTNPTLLGDNLASYYDGGGQVVVGMFALASSYTFAGRFGTVANGYMLMTPGSYYSTVASKGAVNEPNSPLVAGFTALSAGYAFRAYGALVNGAVTVAAWSDGTPLVIRGVIKGRNRADVNLWPTSNAVYTNGWTGDGIILIKNALLYR